MNINELKQNLEKWVQDYAPDCMDSIKRNRHMNELPKDYKEMTYSEIEGLLKRFAVIAIKTYGAELHQNPAKEIKYALGILKLLKDTAMAMYTGRALTTMNKDDRTIIDAITVDFVNYVGACYGIDYGMYTVDLKATNDGRQNDI